jgi:hypothetical protein
MTRASQRLYIHATDFSYSVIATQMRQNSFIEAADEDDVDSLPFSIKTLSDIKSTPFEDLPF